MLKKWEKLLQIFSHFFNKKYWHIWDISVWNFNESLTNDVVSFEQPGLDLKVHQCSIVIKRGTMTEWLETLGLLARIRVCAHVTTEKFLCQSGSKWMPVSNQDRIRQERRGMGFTFHTLCPNIVCLLPPERPLGCGKLFHYVLWKSTCI